VTIEFISTGSAVLDEIAAVIGPKAAIDFGCEFRGERVYIPKDPAHEPRIAAAIGEPLARMLCDAMWRTHVSIPVRAVIHQKVKQLAEDGVTKREIARLLKIREAQVYEILKRWREEPKQLRLF
jgi:Homeodomain-like domain